MWVAPKTRYGERSIENMKRKAFSGIILMLLLTSMLSSVFVIQPVKAAGATIYIRADGTVDPPTAPIQRVGDTYTFTDNIHDRIVVERSNITVDGAGYTLQGYWEGYGFSLSSVSNVTIKRTCIENFAQGMYLNRSSFICIFENNITNNFYGIWLKYSSKNIIHGNKIVTNEYQAIELSDSSYNAIFGNNVTKNGRGLDLSSSSGNIVYNNNITNNKQYGIGAYLASNNTFSENNVVNNRDGFLFFYGSYNSFYQNSITNNREYGIYIEGFNHTISGNDVTSTNRVGVCLWESSKCIVSGNSIINSGSQGLWLNRSPNNTLFRNIITNNAHGIMLHGSSNNIIYGNNMTNNAGDGVFIGESGNKIYHNNFMNNTRQAYSAVENNVWDNGYPSGGNYWSDYNGTDLFSGPYQNETGSDGIGDTLYFIEKYNLDRYPLMKPWTPPPTPDFSFEASPTSLAIQQGDSDTSVITITSINGFNQAVQLSASGGPSGVTATLNPEQVTPPPDGSTTSTLTVLVNTTATLGSHTLTVTGTSGTLTHSASISLEITALPPPTENQPPVADAGLDQSVSSGDLVIFNGSKSGDPDGTIISYLWDFGNGATAEGKIVSHRFRGAQNEPKTYTVTLTVEDNDGATNTDTVDVNVAPLEKTVEVSEPPLLAKMTVTYNWVDKSNGEDVYIISGIHVEAKGFAGTFVPTIWVWEYVYPLGELPVIDFLDYLFIWGRHTEKTYEPPFLTKPVIGISPSIAKRTFDEGTFEGIEVKGSDVMSIYAQGFTLKVGWLPIGVELFEFSATSFDPHAPAAEPGLIQELLDKLLDELPDLIMGHMGSAGELRVYDSEGHVTGLVNGEVKEEILNSVYFNNTVMILYSNSSYRYEVAGTEDGSYGLLVASFIQRESTTFTATDIPISADAVHQYTVDWVALSQGEEGVTVKVDSDGDGIFEKTFTSDSELTREEFMLQVLPVQVFPMWIVGVAVATIAIATAAIAVFWRRRKRLP